jgi:hypothetical protein
MLTPPHNHRLLQRLLLAGVLTAFTASAARADQFEFFEKRIRPVLVERCYECHSADSKKLKGGLLLDTRAGLLKGGESGKSSVVPGDAERSLLVEAIRYDNQNLQMPPKHRLAAAQVNDFVTWINSGALDPRTNGSAPSTAGARLASNAHWAFQPPRNPLPPVVRLHSWPQTPIDRFILAKLEANGLTPSPPADKRTLLRRVTYDLTGLPPTLQQVEAFLNDTSKEAFARVVDRLLASPQYGERWGRYWLDVARYSDTKGYVYDREEKRFVHSHVYRDWVIAAFNDDLPYDQFLLHQIAGDQLPAGPSSASLARSPRAALGFLTIGRRFLGVQHDIIDDRIDVLTRGTMGLTVTCARCHDHKFDPIPIQDYYSLYGVFNSTSERTVPLHDEAEPTKPYADFLKGLREREAKLASTLQKKREQLSDRLRGKVKDYLVAVLDVASLPNEEFYAIIYGDDLNPVIVRQWEACLFRTRESFHPVFAPWHAYASLPKSDFARQAEAVHHQFVNPPADARQRVNPLVQAAFSGPPPASMREVAERYGEVFSKVDQSWRQALKTAATNQAAAPTALDPDQEPIRQILYGSDSPVNVPNGAIVDIEWLFDESVRIELTKLQAEIDRWMINSPGAPPHSVILADRSQPRNGRVFLRGNPANKGPEVPRQFLQVLAGANRKPFTHGSGRLELAQAIASRDNPLTARVMANRIWLHHFGTGLVRTPSDFGTRADHPTHPELLDWLAISFMEGGWSMKKLHRLILLSSVYQQSSDPEESRRGGKSGKDSVAAKTMSDPENRLLWRMNKHRLDFEAMRDSLLTVSGELDPAPGGKAVDLFGKNPSARRAIYGYIDRQFMPGLLQVFDFANPDIHVPQRSETTVPQQALFFMNSAFVVDRARALAKRSEEKMPQRLDDQVRQLYRNVYQRDPTAEDLRLARAFIDTTLTQPPPAPPVHIVSAWQYGYGAFDESTQRTTNFTLLPHFTGEAWQGGAAWPDAKLGWVQLTADGGHAGNDRQHAAIRRWIAPQDAQVSIQGPVIHEHSAGDGITARIVSNRAGLLGTWTLHNQKGEAAVERIEVKQGDVLDFLVDFRSNLNSDMFKWSPVITQIDAAAPKRTSWSAKQEFGGSPNPPPAPLSAWEKFAQVLLLSNEFVFVD